MSRSCAIPVFTEGKLRGDLAPSAGLFTFSMLLSLSQAGAP